MGRPGRKPRAEEVALRARIENLYLTGLRLRDVQRGGSPHITPGNRFYREEAAALLACLPPLAAASQGDEGLRARIDKGRAALAAREEKQP